MLFWTLVNCGLFICPLYPTGVESSESLMRLLWGPSSHLSRLSSNSRLFAGLAMHLYVFAVYLQHSLRSTEYLQSTEYTVAPTDQPVTATVCSISVQNRPHLILKDRRAHHFTHPLVAELMLRSEIESSV